MTRKFRQCPSCKSKKGFSYQYTIVGYGREDRTFEGKVIDADRGTCDDLDKYGYCLDCGAKIDINRLDTTKQ